jgi:hypothetical protein
MNWNIESMQFLWQVFITFVSIGAFIFGWVGRRSNVTNETIEQLYNRLNGIDSRVTSVEQAQKHAPNTDDLTSIRNEMGRVANAVAELSGKVSGELGGMTRQLQLIQEHLLNSK